MIGSDRLKSVEHIIYMGNVFSAATVDNEMKTRIAKAFRKLRYTVWNRDGSSVATKIKVYRAEFILVLFYASETGTFTPYIKNNWTNFIWAVFVACFGWKWFYKISNKVVLQNKKPIHFVSSWKAPGEICKPCFQNAQSLYTKTVSV